MDVSSGTCLSYLYLDMIDVRVPNHLFERVRFLTFATLRCTVLSRVDSLVSRSLIKRVTCRADPICLSRIERTPIVSSEIFILLDACAISVMN